MFRMGKVKAAADAIGSFTTGGPPPLPPVPPPPSSSWTAPTQPVPAPPPAPAATPAAPVATPAAPVVTPADPSAILDELVENVEGVRSAILASVDGFGLARSNSMAHEASHPAMLAAAIGLAHQLAAIGGGSQLRQLVVDHDGGLMLVWPIGDQRVVAVLAATTVEQRRVRAFIQAWAPRLAGAVS